MPAIAPAPAPPPKPSTPPSRPAPKPAPAPAPKPAQSRQDVKPAIPDPAQTGAFDDAFADIDQIEAKESGKPTPPAPKQEKKPEPKDDASADDEDSPKDETKPEKAEAKETKDEAKPTTDEAKPVRAAELRTAYEKSKETIKSKDAEIAKLKSDLESRAKTEDPEKKTLAERLQATEKRLAEYEEEIRFTNFKNHPEFKEKYEAPYHAAFARAVADFEQITVSDEEGAKRPATRADLDSMLRMSVAQVDELAHEKFGHSATRVIRHVEKLRDLADSYHSALEDAKAKGGERETQRALQMKTQNEQRTKMWQDENDAVAKKYPHRFTPVEGDAEVNKALEDGYKLADAVFLHRDQEPPERLVKLDAAVRNRAAAFGRLVLETKRKDAKIKELEEALKAYEDSDPETGGDEPAKDAPIGGWQTDAFNELDAIERKSRK